MPRNIWTTRKIKKEFSVFFKEHGRLPTANEIDNISTLPSSRYIQKRFGGLVSLRGELGYTQTNFSRGLNRSTIARDALERSKDIKTDMLCTLEGLFNSDCIFPEHTFYGRHRVDFYIKTENCHFGIDIFYAQNMRTLQSSVNIKMKKYHYFSKPLYLVVANNIFSQIQLNAYSQRRKEPFPPHIQLLTLLHLQKKVLQHLSQEN